MSRLNDKELLARIEGALDQVRPYMEADGGNISVVDITDDMILKIQLEGACGSCKMSAMTMQAGVEQAVVRAVPEILAVEAVINADL